MRDNNGFSLIEIIVVLCIAALLVSGTAIGIRSLHYADAQYCVKELNSALYTLRANTLSQGELHHYLVIEWDDSNQEYNLILATSTDVIKNKTEWESAKSTIEEENAKLKISSHKKLASRLITISYSTNKTSFSEIRNANSVILISYKADSGAFESGYKQIRVTSNNNSSTLFMVTSTGNHYIR